MFTFVNAATRHYEYPNIRLPGAEPLSKEQKIPITNEAGVGVFQLLGAASLEARIAETGVRVAPSKYLGWSLYNLDSDVQSWELVSEVRGDHSFTWKHVNHAHAASEVSPYYLLACSVRSRIFSGEASVSAEKVARALEMNPDLTQSVVYLVWTPQKEEQTSTLQKEEQTSAEIDLRTSIDGDEVEQTETVIAESANGKSATAASQPGVAVAVPPRQGREPSDAPVLTDFEGELPEMDIKVLFDVSLSADGFVGLLEKYGMALYATTYESYQPLDGAWTCYSFADKMTLNQKQWDMDLETVLKNYGNQGPSFDSLPKVLQQAVVEVLPVDFGGDLNPGTFLLGGAILVANEAVTEFAKTRGPEPSKSAYQVELRFTSGEVTATSVKDKVKP